MGIEIIAAWFFKDLGLVPIWKDLVASRTPNAALAFRNRGESFQLGVRKVVLENRAEI
jgi:hypothetical protein